MEIKRFFFPPAALVGDTIEFRGDEFRHMTTVLRHKAGYKLVASDGDGMDYYCTIEAIFADCAVARIDEVVPNVAVPRTAVTLFQALPKGDKADLIVQKSVELGASAVRFFFSAHTAERKFNEQRLNKIALEACKQCGRERAVPVYAPVSFEAAVAEASRADLFVMPYEREKNASLRGVFGRQDCGSVSLMIGSEGGYSAEEAQAARARGARTVTLGRRILRCETAAVAALTLVMYELGELGGV